MFTFLDELKWLLTVTIERYWTREMRLKLIVKSTSKYTGKTTTETCHVVWVKEVRGVYTACDGKAPLESYRKYSTSYGYLTPGVTTNKLAVRREGRFFHLDVEV